MTNSTPNNLKKKNTANKELPSKTSNEKNQSASMGFH